MAKTESWWMSILNLLVNLITKRRLRDVDISTGIPVATSSDIGSGYDRESEEMRQRSDIVDFMVAQIDDPYTYGAEIDFDDPDPKTGDCSEYMEQGYVRAGLEYPDGSANQKRFCGPRRVIEPKPGDPFFFGPNRDGVPHTGAYIGGGLVVHAVGGRIGKVIKQSRENIEAHPRFEGWFRHPDFAWPVEERA